VLKLVDCTALLFQNYDMKEMDAERIPHLDVLGLLLSFETGLICSKAASTQPLTQAIRMTTVTFLD
jgi:hypothetical protein